MSLLAADRRAVAVTPLSMAHVEGTPQVENFQKITLNRSRSLAVGIAGLTHEHGYTWAVERTVTVNEALSAICDHVNGFLRIHDRASLIPLSSATANQGIASFFDSIAGVYFSMEYRFSPVQCSTRLYPGRDRARILCAGTGSEHFEEAVGTSEIESFIAATKDTVGVEACISWVRDAFKSISARDASFGSNPVVFISTRSQLQFRSL